MGRGGTSYQAAQGLNLAVAVNELPRMTLPSKRNIGDERTQVICKNNLGRAPAAFRYNGFVIYYVVLKHQPKYTLDLP
jgi:hypothetical protein